MLWVWRLWHPQPQHAWKSGLCISMETERDSTAHPSAITAQGLVVEWMGESLNLRHTHLPPPQASCHGQLPELLHDRPPVFICKQHLRAMVAAPRLQRNCVATVMCCCLPTCAPSCFCLPCRLPRLLL